jgi:undecaprenyl-diphosphatase
MVVGFVMAFVVAWLAVAGFMRYIQKRSLEPFAIYRVVLGGVVLIHWWLVR